MRIKRRGRVRRSGLKSVQLHSHVKCYASVQKSVALPIVSIRNRPWRLVVAYHRQNCIPLTWTRQDAKLASVSSLAAIMSRSNCYPLLNACSTKALTLAIAVVIFLSISKFMRPARLESNTSTLLVLFQLPITYKRIRQPLTIQSSVGNQSFLALRYDDIAVITNPYLVVILYRKSQLIE